MDNDARTVAVIGLGAMGLPVVRHLLGSGFAVTVRDVNPRAVAAAVALGARPADTAADAARPAWVVAIFVPTDSDVLDVCLGSAGALAGAQPDAVILLCSSVSASTCQQVAQEAPPGVDVLDAALTGGVRAAESAAVNLLVGGDPATVDRVRPALAPWTSAVHHLGPLGSGQLGKTAHNLLHWAQVCAITEALELGRRCGLDVPTLRRALMDGPVDSRALRELEQMKLRWHQKDLAHAVALAAQTNVDAPLAETSRRVLGSIDAEDVARLLAGGPLHAPE